MAVSLLESLFGNPDEIERDANLLRKSENGKCPVCKKDVRKNEHNDEFCTDYNINYKKQGGCYWHMYSDGSNYWSAPEDVLKHYTDMLCEKAKDNPELAEKLKQAGIDIC